MKVISRYALVLVATAPASAWASYCAAPEQHQLDFWVGHWVVHDSASGDVVGESLIEAVQDGCAISEHYSAPKAPGGPYSGASYSAYDRKDRSWHQMYVDVNGNVTGYTGAVVGDRMVLRAQGPQDPVRMSYRKLADGSVEQIGESSSDGGTTWQPRYDYTYRRR